MVGKEDDPFLLGPSNFSGANCYSKLRERFTIVLFSPPRNEVLFRVFLALINERCIAPEHHSGNVARRSWGWKWMDMTGNPVDVLLLEEILHHLGCVKPCKSWDMLFINWCRISSINSVIPKPYGGFMQNSGTIFQNCHQTTSPQNIGYQAEWVFQKVACGIWMDVYVINRDSRDYIVISLSNSRFIKNLLKILSILYNCMSLDLNVFWHRFLPQKVEVLDEPLNCTNSHFFASDLWSIVKLYHPCIAV